METIATQGIDIPRLGLGTFGMTGAEAQAAVENAASLGYRHFDTATMYENEDAVGAGIAATGLPREDVFITTKVWHTHLAPNLMQGVFEQSLEKLGTDYVDLYMVHWPTPDMDLAATLEAIIRLKERGLIRAMGVCNFPLALMRKAMDEIGAPLAALQVEYHPFLSQATLLDYVQKKGMAMTAYCPVAKGTSSEDATLVAIGQKHGVGGAQIALAWLLDQKGVVAIPKAASPKNQQANFSALNVRLDDEDRAAIGALPKNKRLVNPAFAPVWDTE
ncbi:aldo/keto reductase [Hwanghaeella grinnelliae]|uniref:Aldo/keto reductase n=1 Tax=Hwanghaeella grinnelliae TaxID=2500179 RepID=A0A437QXH3_9PROT|nr:aldo/keto reductase [Hwanghaeella grinnelliae]RVU39214.1 aldo/keto reductase [Hwanghaeella grinnelliae]